MPDIMVLPEIILDIEFVGKNNMASISARFSYKLTSFSTEWMQKHNFGLYHRGFRYARHSGAVGKYLSYCIMRKIQNGHNL